MLSVLRPVLLAGIVVLVATSALGQPYAPYMDQPAPSAGPNETVTVIAPRFRTETSPLNGPLEKMSLSIPVRYTVQDLVDPARSEALRWRVWRTAHDVCDRLEEAYPVYPLSSARSCFHDAYDDAMTKIDARMSGARLAYWYGY